MLEIINRDKGSEHMVKDSKFFKFLKGIFSKDETLDEHEQKLKYICHTYILDFNEKSNIFLFSDNLQNYR